VNIEIMRAFVRMRELLTSNKELAQQLKKLERNVSTHDEAIVGNCRYVSGLVNATNSRPTIAPSICAV
jgi:hypothetical protein